MEGEGDRKQKIENSEEGEDATSNEPFISKTNNLEEEKGDKNETNKVN